MARELIARIQTALSAQGSDSGAANMLSGKVTIEFHDYGEPVTIAAPPADQVKDAAEALSIFGGGRDAGRTP